MDRYIDGTVAQVFNSLPNYSNNKGNVKSFQFLRTQRLKYPLVSLEKEKSFSLMMKSVKQEVNHRISKVMDVLICNLYSTQIQKFIKKRLVH